MIGLRIILEGDGALEDIKDAIVVSPEDGPLIRVLALKEGMVSGAPSVAFAIPMPDGKWLFAQTSMHLFLAAARSFQARFEEELEATL